MIFLSRTLVSTLWRLAAMTTLVCLCASPLSWAAAGAKPADVESVDAIVRASYEAASGRAEETDVERFRFLLQPGARMIAVSERDGRPAVVVRSVDEFLEGFRTRKSGVLEREIARQTQTYDGMVHVWSTYELRSVPDDGKPRHGINSLQLVNDGQRWWIVSAVWQNETPGRKVPSAYLGREK